MLVIQISTKAQLALVLSDIQNNRLLCSGISFHATRQAERLTDTEVAAFLSILKDTLQAQIWTTLRLSGHRLKAQLDLSFFSNLRCLDLRDNCFTRMPLLPVHSLLNTIDMDGNDLTETPYLPAHPNLREFSIRYNKLTQSFHDLNKMPYLQKLFATENDFRSIPLDDFSKLNPEYHLSSRHYTEAARVLAYAANKHLYMNMYGYKRIKGDAPQLSSKDLHKHFAKMPFQYAPICARDFVSQNFVALSVLTTNPAAQGLPLEIADKILAYTIELMDPVTTEFNKFACVFARTAGLGYPLFELSKDVWEQFVRSKECSDIKDANENALRNYRVNILKDLQKKPRIKALLFANHDKQSKAYFAAPRRGPHSANGNQTKKQRLI